ncbi:MAG: M56 family metallopeptidase [Fuerstiella sp.]
MLNTSVHWLLVAIDVSVKSLLMAVVAILLLRLLRIRNSGVRHRVWAGVLCGMLTLPILSRIVPTVPLPFSIDTAWLNSLAEYDLPSEQIAEPESSGPGISAMPAEFIEAPATAANEPFRQQWPSSTPAAPTSFQTPPERSRADVDLHFVTQEAAPDVDATEGQPAHASAPRVPSHIKVLRWLPLAVAVVWLAGAMTMLLRLLLGLVATRGIVHRAINVAGFVPQDSRARVRESSEVRVPVTVGLFRPCILLPTEWREWSSEKLRAVMTHESSHVERSDFSFAVLAELNRCLYWFHPLSWWLRIRLSDLAEEACDDAAIGLTGDPTGYARHLLEVAASLSPGEGRVCRPGLSMARKSNVEGRIHTILDLTRPLSDRLTWKATALIVAVMLPVIAMAAAIRPAGPKETSTELVQDADRETPGNNAGVVGDSQSVSDSGHRPGSPESPAASATPPANYTLAGTVLNPDGTPAVGARLYLVYSGRRLDDGKSSFAETDREGHFEATVDAAICDGQTSIIARSKLWEYGFGHKPAVVFDASGELEKTTEDYWKEILKKRLRNREAVIQLVPDLPVRGKVLTAEGIPVVGARIQVLNVLDGREGNLDNWRTEATKEHADYSKVVKHIHRVVGRDLTLTAFAASRTDDTGSFFVQGLGKDRIASLAILSTGWRSPRQKFE